jgi:CelD/BcsL family acetyltransferase involved in cellulose biosynthesis
MKHSNPNSIIQSMLNGDPAAGTSTREQAIAFADALDISIHDSIKSIKTDWLVAEKTANISVYQRYHWVEAYLQANSKTEKIQPFIIVGRLKNDIVFILPCTLHGRFGTRVKFIGGKHVNVNLGIFPQAFRDVITPRCFGQIFARIRKLVPGIGYLGLCCQPENWNGSPNPLLREPHQRSANPAFLINLSGGFDETLARGNAKRKRKKFRQQVRQCEALGGYQLYKPDGIEEINYLIDQFLAQKSKRLKSLGIKDVFADEGIKEFLVGLATSSTKHKSPLLQLYALKIGNQTAAVFGAGAMGKHLSGYFSSIDAEQFGEVSPGEMLLYLVVEDACAQGYEMFDLGAGDERYKRSWSTDKIDMYDMIVPYNYKAAPVVYLRRAYGAVRRTIRENETYWNAYKTIRKMIPSLWNKA